MMGTGQINVIPMDAQNAPETVTRATFNPIVQQCAVAQALSLPCARYLVVSHLMRILEKLLF